MKKLIVCKSNPFSLAELRLIKEKRDGVIPCYTTDDVIAYAIEIREWLENNSKRLVKLTEKEKIKIKHKKDRDYYINVVVKHKKQRK